MFGRERTKDERAAIEPKLQCSFCKKSQDDVRKLIAGPAVYICDECVTVCVDIIADDARAERAVADRGDRPAQEAPRWSASATCTLCRMPLVLEEALTVENRALLCRPCVSAIQAAAAQADDEAHAAPDVKR